MSRILEYQPTESSCGPTSIKIACNILNIHQDKTPLEIFSYCKNQRKGAPWWRMLDMLDKLDINYQANVGSYQQLITNLKEEKITLLSVDMEGIKHWCVALFVDPKNTKTITFFDPYLGYYEADFDHLYKLTKSRSFFHICVNTETKNKYFVDPVFRYIDNNDMILVGEANDYFDQKVFYGCDESKILAYGENGEIIWAR